MAVAVVVLILAVILVMAFVTFVTLLAVITLVAAVQLHCTDRIMILYLARCSSLDALSAMTTGWRYKINGVDHLKLPDSKAAIRFILQTKEYIVPKTDNSYIAQATI